MRIIKQSFDVIDWGAERGIDILKKIERAGRTCYQSSELATDDSSIRFCEMLNRLGHHSVLEHHNITCRLITNRGVLTELTRHRLASYSVESSRYVNYGGKEIEFIWPVWLDEEHYKAVTADGINSTLPEVNSFLSTLQHSASMYVSLLDQGWRPEHAREVLPNALKTEIIMTANIREFLHIFNLRCSKKSHPQIRALMLDGLKQFKDFIPRLFDGLWEKYGERNVL